MTSALDPTVRAYMSSLAARREQVAGTCEQCKRPFTRTRRARFCSDACRMKAYQPRRKRNKTASQESSPA